MIAAERHPVEVACRVLDVSVSGYYMSRIRPPSKRSVRHAWLTDTITQIHTASRGTYGARRVHAELTLGHGICRRSQCGGDADAPSWPEGTARTSGVAAQHTDPDSKRSVDRNFARDDPNRLWVTDITEHPTREGKVYCAVVLDAFSRRVVGWSIDSVTDRDPGHQRARHGHRTTADPTGGGDHPLRPRHAVHLLGLHPTAPRIRPRARRWARSATASTTRSSSRSGARMQTELLNRKRWRTRIELANAIFDYLEIFHNRQRRHSALGMLTPIEFEILHQQQPVA